MRKLILIVLIAIIPVLALSQFAPDKIQKNIESTFEGTIILNDSSEVSGLCKYNPSVPGGLLSIERDGFTETFTAKSARGFFFFDAQTASQRNFYSIPITDDYGIPRSYFLEIVFAGRSISILGQNTFVLHKRSTFIGPTPIEVRTQAALKSYEKYLFDHRDKSVHYFSKEVLLQLMNDKKDQVSSFRKSNKLKLGADQTDQYITLIQYYDSLEDHQ